MTHTLHPEIEKTIQRLVNRIKQDVVTGKEDDVYGLIIGYLGPYLLPPSQHLKDKATMYFGDEGGQGGAEVHIYSTVNDNEPLPEKVIDDKTKLGIYDTTQNIMQDIRTYVYEYDEVQKMRLLALLDKHLLKFGGQEQTTPKIDMDKLNMMLYAGSDMEGNSWGADIPGAIKMIADYINNKD